MAKQPIGDCTLITLNPVGGTRRGINWDRRANKVLITVVGSEGILFCTPENPETSAILTPLGVNEVTLMESAEQAMSFRATSATANSATIVVQQFRG